MLKSTRERFEALGCRVAQLEVYNEGLRTEVTAIRAKLERIHTEFQDHVYAAGKYPGADNVRADLNRIGAEVQKLLLIPGLQEVAEVPARTIPGTPARYELKKR